MNPIKTLTLSTAILVMTTAAQAGNLPFDGTDITIYDGQGSGTGWHGAQEDQEVEANSAASQLWDLEGWFLQADKKVGMVGGFDFVNGVDGYDGQAGDPDYRSGDIFIDTDGQRTLNGDESSPAGQAVVEDTFGYEYAFDINWETLTYDLVALGAGTSTQLPQFDMHYGSSPWKYDNGGTVIASGLTFAVASGLSDSDTGFLGGNHYAAYDFDVAFLEGFDATFHFTMGCGNDNLMGMAEIPTSDVPEPAGFGLMAIGLAGLIAARRRQAKR